MNVRQRIEQIYSLIEKIPVAGGSVDVMATVRAELRALHKIALAQEVKEAKKAKEKEKPILEPDPDPNDGKEERDG